MRIATFLHLPEMVGIFEIYVAKCNQHASSCSYLPSAKYAVTFDKTFNARILMEIKHFWYLACETVFLLF